MKLRILGWLLAGLIPVSAAVLPPLVRWMNEDTAAQRAFRIAEHNKYYGKNAEMVLMPFSFNTNVVVDVGSGTNRFPIEFGFRDDGVVVWRKR